MFHLDPSSQALSPGRGNCSGFDTAFAGEFFFFCDKPASHELTKIAALVCFAHQNDIMDRFRPFYDVVTSEYPSDIASSIMGPPALLAALKRIENEALS